MKHLYILTLIVAAGLLAACAAPVEPLPNADNPAGGISPADDLLPEGEQTVDEIPPDLSKGGVRTLPLMDRSLLQFPVQAPAVEQMAALFEGQLIIDNNCLRVTSAEYPAPGFLVIWPAGYEPHIGPADGIDIVDGNGEVAAHPNVPVKLSGGAMESERSMRIWDDQIDGLPIDDCPGPYWIAGEVVPLN